MATIGCRITIKQRSAVVSKICLLLKVNNAAGLNKIPARLVRSRDAEVELVPSLAMGSCANLSH